MSVANITDSLYNGTYKPTTINQDLDTVWRVYNHLSPDDLVGIKLLPVKTKVSVLRSVVYAAYQGRYPSALSPNDQ